MEEEMDETLRPGPAKKIWRRSESPPSFEGKDLESSPGFVPSGDCRRVLP